MIPLGPTTINLYDTVSMRHTCILSDQDPLEFMRSTAKQLGLDLEFNYTLQKSSTDFYAYMRKKDEQGTRDLSVIMDYKTKYARKETKAAVAELLNNPKKKPSFDLETKVMDDLGKYAKGTTLSISYDYQGHDEEDPSTAVSVFISQAKPGVFATDNVQFYGDDLGFLEIADKSYGDYRPYVHRLIEHFAGVPRDRWHDPTQYSQVKKKTRLPKNAPRPDPLDHFRSIAVELELPLESAKEWRLERFVEERGRKPANIYGARFSDHDRVLSIYLEPARIRPRKNEDMYRALEAYVNGKSIKGTEPLNSIKLPNFTLSDLGIFASYFDVIFEIYKKNPYVGTLLHVRSSDDSFRSKLVKLDDTLSHPSVFNGISGGDYPSTIRRMIEIYRGVPLSATSQNQGNLDALLSVFFSGSELERLKEKTNALRLHTGLYSSVPRLNIGVKQTFTKEGVSELYQGANALMQILAQSQIMTLKEAETLLMNKLQNMLLSHPDFQKNPTLASQLIDALNT